MSYGGSGGCEHFSLMQHFRSMGLTLISAHKTAAATEVARQVVTEADTVTEEVTLEAAGAFFPSRCLVASLA